MAINPVAANVPNTAVKLCDVPPGVGSVTISVAAANTTVVYVGTTANVTASFATGNTGAAVVGGASVTIPMFAGSKGTTLYGVANVAGPTPVGIFISTAG